MSLSRVAFVGIVTLCVAVGASCGGTVVTQASGATTGTGGGVHASSSTATSTTATGTSSSATTNSSASGAPDAGPDAGQGTLCQQVPCVPPDGGACGGCMTSCGPFTSTCASDPTCTCVMAHGHEFCPFNAQAVTCMAQTGSVSVTCGPCI
jgi:hypothetical protein